MPSKCTHCGQPAAFDDADECTNCWEVRKRIPEFLNTPGNLEWLTEQILGKETP